MTAAQAFSRVRKAEGLYDPAFEHDACGVAFVATLTGLPSHTIVAQGLEALRNLDHRGAVGSDPKTGDGAGMLLQIPDRFLRGEVDLNSPDKARTPSEMRSFPQILSSPARRRPASSKSRRKRICGSSAGAASQPTTPR